MNAKKAMRKFLKHLAAAPVGAHFEVGTVWDQKSGWRVYQRVGDKGLAMGSGEVRALLAIFEKQAAMPEWRQAAAEMRPAFVCLKECADDVDRMNRDKVVPPDVTLVAPEAGHA